MLTSELKKFQGKQLVLLCLCKNDGNAVAHSISCTKNCQKERSYKKVRPPDLLTFFDPSKTDLVMVFSSRVVHTLCLAQIFGRTDAPITVRVQ